MTGSDSIQTINTNVYSFDKTHAPAAHARPGEMLRFQTLDCFSNRLTSEEVLPSHLNYGYDVCNPAAGPVYIEGAEPGDILVVEILDIQVASEGTISTDTYMYMSVRCHVEVDQACVPCEVPMILRLGVPKNR